MSPSSPGFRGKRPPSAGPGGAQVGEVLSELFQRRPWGSGVAIGELARTWADVVGERLAEETSPAGLEGGVLLVRATSAAWAAQVRFLTEEIRQRADSALGGNAVKGVRIIVDRGSAGRPGRAERP